MINIQLNEHSAEDCKAIMALREIGFSDEEIQAKYDEQLKADKEVEDED